MSWHADHDALIRYAAGRIDEAEAFSIEAHMPGCPLCRTVLSSLIERGRLEGMWRDVADAVDGPRGNVLQRLLTRVGVQDHTARLLAATPSLRLSWILAVGVALGFAVLAARDAGLGALPFLILAPLVPVAGVGAAYGSAMDPVHEIGLASPTGGFRLLLIRATAVLLTSVALAGMLALGLPELGWTAAAWLLPALALTILALALSSVMTPHAAVAAVAVSWVIGVAVTERIASQPLAAFGLAAQTVFAAIAVASASLLAIRRQRFELRSRM